MSAITPIMIAEAVQALAPIAAKMVDLVAEMERKRRTTAEDLARTRAEIDNLRKNLSAIGDGLEAYIEAHLKLADIETKCKTVRDYLSENMSDLMPDSDKWSTLRYMLQYINDASDQYDTIRRNPRSLFEREDLLTVEGSIDDFKAARVKADLSWEQRDGKELQRYINDMVQEAGQIVQVFQERISTTLYALKKI